MITPFPNWGCFTLEPMPSITSVMTNHKEQQGSGNPEDHCYQINEHLRVSKHKNNSLLKDTIISEGCLKCLGQLLFIK
jgi:hypothetical protein